MPNDLRALRALAEEWEDEAKDIDRTHGADWSYVLSDVYRKVARDLTAALDKLEEETDAE